MIFHLTGRRMRTNNSVVVVPTVLGDLMCSIDFCSSAVSCKII